VAKATKLAARGATRNAGRLTTDDRLLAGRYRVQRSLGAGSQGRVWLAFDGSDGDAPRAVKVVPPEHGQRLRWEWDVLARVQHPAVARVRDLLRLTEAHPELDLPAGAVLMVTDQAPGEPLDRALALLGSTLGSRVPSVIVAGFSVARALSAFHRAGLVHGDVKPTNILFQSSPFTRATLIDPGLSGPPSLSSTIDGTPAYLAPEAWRGERSFAADSFALGITLQCSLAAAPLIDPQTSSSSDVSSDAGRWFRDALLAPERARALSSEVPEALRTLIVELVATDPSTRPTATEAAARLAAIARSSRVPLPSFEGDGPGDLSIGGGADELESDAERAAAILTLPLAGQRVALADLITRLATGAVTRVVGPHGSGRSRLVREAVAALQAKRVASDASAPSYLCVEAIPQRLPSHDCIVHVTRAQGADAEQARGLLLEARIDGRLVSVVLEGDWDDTQEGDVVVAPLPREAIEQLLGDALPRTRIDDAWVDDAIAASGGLAGRLCRLLADVCLQDGERITSERLRAFAETSSPSTSVVIPKSSRSLACLAACSGGVLDVATARNVLGAEVDLALAMHTLTERGIATLARDGSLTLRPDLVGKLTTLLPASEVAEIAQRALGLTSDAVRRAYLLDAAGDRSVGAWRQAIAQLRLAGKPDLALRVGRDALDRTVEGAREVIALESARALLLLGRYTEVAALLSPYSAVDAGLLIAEAERRAGRLDTARGALDRINATAADRASDVHAVWARIEFDAGNLEAAQGHAALTTPGTSWARARGLEVTALYALRSGDHAAARAAAEAALTAARDTTDLPEIARATSVLATVVLANGDVAAAAAQYANALEVAERAGDVHGAALCLLNLGLARVDHGDVGPGLLALRDAARRLLRVGRTSDAARALYNLGNAASLAGDDDMALSALTLAQDASVSGDVPAARAYALLCEAEIAVRRGRSDDASELLKKLAAVAPLSTDERAVIAGRGAVLWSAIGDATGDGSAAIRWLAAHDPGEAAALSALATAELEMARARISVGAGELAQGVDAAQRALTTAERSGTFELRLRGVLTLADAFDAAGRSSEAARCFETARNLLDQVALGLSPSERARLRQVASYRQAFRASPAARVDSSVPPIDNRWRKLATLSARLVGEQSTRRLLDRVLDAAIELANAERGFVVVRSDDGLSVRASRGLTASYLADASVPSRTFVARVICDGRPMASVDALRDERLDGAASVHALLLRSVIAVPLRADEVVTGAIYLDDRLRPFAFGEEEIALLMSLADIAALALNGARRLRAERVATKRMNRLRERLRRTVETQALELSSLRGSDDVVVDHPSIVGRGQAMRALLAMVDRVARSELPVLIAGESGTGKELVARTIHDHGPRQGTAFVSENCSAIPETLLESALFGHVRGAFTGADRARVGLFDAADGGTLFLDEVGEMSAAMQTRLLRVLQDGEIRSVGTERTRKVDVRVIAATHRDLEQMVREGTFREDLYYRLAVVSLKMPALRDRPEDIPELVAHFVRKHALPDNPVRVDRKTVALLSKHPWPGNVRQLENEIRRALVLSDGVVRPENLSSALSGDPHVPPSDLDLRGQSDLLERRLIRAALDQTRNNQTQAAKLLGVSRFGLQKMLKRLGVTG